MVARMAGVIVVVGVVVGGVVLIVVLDAVVQVFRDVRRLGIKPRRVCVEVGDSETISVGLLHKPRWTYNWKAEGGQATFDRNSSPIYQLGSGGNVVTRGVDPSVMRASESVVGLQVGEAPCTVSGIAADGSDYGVEDVDVLVIGVDPTFLQAFTQAAHHHNDSWRHGTSGNLLGGEKCDQWADWMVSWIKTHSRGRVCKVEKVTWEGWAPWGWGRHVCVRITLCEGGVYYLDPWRYGPKADSWRKKEDYEKEHGEPDDAAEY